MVRRHDKSGNNTIKTDDFKLKPTAACVRMVIAGGLAFSQAAPVQAELPTTAQALASMPFAAAGAGVSLPPIGLNALPQPSVQFVTPGNNLGTAQATTSGNTLTINQNGERVILNYDSFNVGQNAAVQFIQPSDVAIALNRVTDVTGNPSQILGRIDANGQVYIVNHNGFVFGEKSVVDTHGLVASALDVSEAAFKGTGITEQIVNGTDNAPALSGTTSCANLSACIDVKSGAVINVNEGRTAILAAPTVSNAGQITGGRNSQIILVASEDKVYLQTTNDANNEDFQGLLVEVGKGGNVTNSGSLAVRQGNITLAGFTVNQNGRISSTTSVNTNGSIRLLAEEGATTVTVGAQTTLIPGTQGTVRNGRGSVVTFGAGSVTEILPDTEGLSPNSSDGVPEDNLLTPGFDEFAAFTAPDSQTQPRSLIEARAHDILLQGTGSQGAQIVAPSAVVNFTATDRPIDAQGTAASVLRTGSSGSIILQSGAKIDVSGTDYVSVPIERNVAEVVVQSINLANSPFQRGGPLQGATVRVDVRKNTTVADVSSGADTIRRGVAERLSGRIIDPNGRVTGQSGEINFLSSGQVIVNSGSAVDISGGAIQFRDGFINTTRLITPQGRLVEISDANPNERYIGIFGIIDEFHTKWLGDTPISYNILGPFGAAQFERGYTQGTAAGTLNISSPDVQFDGQLIANVENGVNQRNAPLRGGKLNIDYSVFNADQNASRVTSLTGAQNVVINGLNPSGTDSQSENTLSLSTENLIGVGDITVNTFGKVIFDGTIDLPVNSNVKIDASNGIELKGSIHSAGGVVTLTSNSTVSELPDAGKLSIFNNSVIDLSGRFVNDFQRNLAGNNNDQALINDLVVLNGGTLTISAQGDLNYGQNIVIRADGGALNTSANRLTAGDAGNISITAGAGAGSISQFEGAGVKLVDTSKVGSNGEFAQLENAALNLGGNISAYGLFKNGNLTLNTSNSINFGNSGNVVNASALNFTVPGNFGFSQLTLSSSLGNFVIEENTNLSFVTSNFILENQQVGSQGYQQLASAESLRALGAAVRIGELRDDLKTDPVNLNLSGGLFRLGRGSSISLLGENASDAGGSVTIGSNNIDIEGSLIVPAGTITLGPPELELAGAPTFNQLVRTGIYLGEQSRLSTAGVVILNPADALGRVTGRVLDGGNVAITSELGYIAQAQGSVIDVSGTSSVLDIPVSESRANGVQFDRRLIGSDAGSISLTAATGLYLDGSLNAQAGSVSNQGGSLTVNIVPGSLNDPTLSALFDSGRRFSIDLIQNDFQILPDNFAFESPVTSITSNNPNYPTLLGRTVISGDEITQAGFDTLRLNFAYQPRVDVVGQVPGQTNRVLVPQGEIRFIGNFDLSVNNLVLNAQTLSAGFDNGSSVGVVRLNTGYLELGSSSFNVVETNPVSGNGVLQATSNYTQLTGALALNRFDQINLTSRNDLRVRGLNSVVDLSGGAANDSTSIGITDNQFVGELKTAGDLNLTAGQIYPSTLSEYAFNIVNNADGQININGQNTGTTPLSAAGKLTFSAPVINQNGVLKAPLGTIELNASRSIVFGANSITSVSAQGSLIPFGAILGTDLVYPLFGINQELDPNGDRVLNLRNIVFNNPNLRPVNPDPDNNPNTPPPIVPNIPLGEKQLAVTSPNVEFRQGSVVDLSGGGDLQAVQFVPGAGGLSDYLSPNSLSYDGGFAVLPALNSSLAPFDPYLSGGFGFNPLATVHLSGTANLPAGDYAILPARYALLPGAFLITPQANSQDQVITLATQFGLPIIPGYQAIAGTNVRDARQTGYLVESSADVQRRSRYTIETAGEFFTQKAQANNTPVPIVPADSGRVQVEITGGGSTRQNLVLQGQFLAEAAKNGRSARLDIAANNIRIVNSRGNASTTELQLLDQDLAALDVGSILLGGTRTFNSTTGQTQVNVSANNVVFDGGTTVSAPDVLAAARNTIDVKDGANIISSGPINTGDTRFVFSGSSGRSALLRVSGDNQASVSSEQGSATNNSTIVFSQGATISASGSVLFSAGTTDLQGSLQLQGGSLSLAADNINLGELGLNTSNSGANALNLSNARLASINADNLVLISNNAINLFGDVGRRDGNGVLNPFQYRSLVLDARAFSGYDNAGKTARLQADNLTLRNTSSVKTALNTGSGNGVLDLIADNYTQESGTIAIDGFSRVNLTASRQFTIAGASGLDIASDLSVTSGNLAGSGGQTLAINAVTRGAGGADIFHNVVFAGVQGAAQAANTNFGGGLAINAASIGLDNVKFDLPSGSLALTAQQGDITVTGQSDINLAGQAVSFADAIALTPGGSFSATSVNGRVTLAQGSIVDVSVAGREANAGNLTLRAPQQTVNLSGQLRAAGANVEIDVSDFGSSNFDGLITALTAAGADGDLSVRARHADIIQLASNIVAANIKLTADEGIIDIFGQLHADNSQLNIQGLKTDGGVIALNAGGKITIENSAVLTATGQNEGGRIILSSIADANDGGGIVVRQGSVLDVSGGARGGQVFFAAARSSSNGGVDDDINIEALDGAVIGARAVYAQGVKTYDADGIGNDNSIDSVDIDSINSDTAAYYAAASGRVASRFAGVGAQLSPDVEIQSAGDLALASVWNLADLRLNNGISVIPVTTVTLRAQGKLDINAGLTDGFDSNGLLSGTSSSFQLIAGADTASADRLATRIIDTTSPNAVQGATLTIGSGASVHTGTGDITIAAAGDFVLADQTSTVFNAGRRDLTDPFGVISDPIIAGVSNLLLNAEYPVDGGNISISTGRDIQVNDTTSPESINSYLIKQNGLDANIGTLNLPGVGVVPLEFRQNIGSFGAGKVNINAGGNINDLNVILPNTFKQKGTVLLENGFDISEVNNRFEVNGGGVLNVNAGGNINGGLYYQGTGVANIRAGGNIAGSTQATNNNIFDDGTTGAEVNAFRGGPLILLSGNNLPEDRVFGNINRVNSVSLSAGGNLNIAGVTDAFLLSRQFGTAEPEAENFFSYTEPSKISFESLGGNIGLVNTSSGSNLGIRQINPTNGTETIVQTNTLEYILNGNSINPGSVVPIQRILREIYPASLEAVAFSGSVQLNSNITLYPSRNSGVDILAKESFSSGQANAFRLILPDSDPITLPSAIDPLDPLETRSGSPLVTIFTNTFVNNIISGNTAATDNISTAALNADLHAIVPLHSEDVLPSRIVTLEGDISNVIVSLSEQSVIQAGRDLVNTPLLIQQSGTNSQNSLIAAGRDIVFPTRLNANGVLQATEDQFIQIAGTGDVLFKTGRNLDLGSSEGIRSIGNLVNGNLPNTGANLSFLIGLNGNTPDYVGFINNYLANNPLYATQFNQANSLIGNFIRSRTGNFALTDQEAQTIFTGLDGDQLGFAQTGLNAVVQQVYFSEIRANGEAFAQTNDPIFNNQGFDVINTLFPDSGYQGDLSLTFSRIQTVTGGDINFLLPGGGVNLGLAVSPNGDKGVIRLGVSAQDFGNINAFTSGDFNVNTSRLFTLNGGDILVWSSFGDINAGSGPRSDLSITFENPLQPAPGVNLPRVARVTGGSGIRTSARPGRVQGDVLLFAPGGIIDAGEAGIAGNNVTLVATAVLNAQNIQVGGVATGVPVPAASVSAGLTGTSNSTANATQAAQAVAGLDEGSSGASKNNAALGLLSIDFLGFGE